MRKVNFFSTILAANEKKKGNFMWNLNKYSAAWTSPFLMLPENVQNMLKFDVHNHPSAIKGNIIMAAWMRASILIFSVILIYVDLFSIFKIKFESSSQQKVHTQSEQQRKQHLVICYAPQVCIFLSQIRDHWRIIHYDRFINRKWN